MKKDLISSIGVAILGVIIAYFVCNLLIGEIQPVDIKVVDETVNTELSDPSPEVFNYKALNPTVEVYVGDCTEVDQYGQCVEEVTEEGNE